MKLEITPYGLRIVTETVQDVGYLKHLGYMDPDPDLYLKIAVVKSWDPRKENPEGAHIDIKWEDALCGSESGGSGVEYECVQYLEGAINTKFGAKRYCNDKADDGSGDCMESDSDIGYKISSTSSDYPKEAGHE